MKILVIGSGGREHALAYRLAASPQVSEVLVAPGNAGTATEAGCRNVAVAADDLSGLLALAQQESVALTVVGPEGPLSQGIVDLFQEAGLRIFGPTQAAAQLEASKAFTKGFLERHGIPTAGYAVFTDAKEACDYVALRGAPIVVKADGLAAGKGVVVATSVAEAQAAIRDMLSGALLGNAGARVVIEDFLSGEEASFIVIAGKDQTYLPMASAQDHKRVGDGDTGPNTGGMGAYSPAPVVTTAVHERVCREVIEPTLAGMAAEGRPFTGFLYAGLMIDDHGAPYVIEFNARMGDPETQPLLMRLESDLVTLLNAAIDGTLDAHPATWSAEATLGVVMAAEHYPASPAKGDAIAGLDADFGCDAKVFHAGTALKDGQVLTAGGRVLCVVGKGSDIRAAQAAAYAAIEKISWRGEFHRGDIGWRAIARLPKT